MKIEHEIANVRVSRYDTVSNALMAVYGKYHLDLVSGLVQGSFRIENQPHLDMLQQWALKKPYDPDEDYFYSRDCALAVLDNPWKIEDLLRSIDERGFYAASTSETTAYLRELKQRQIKFGAIVHLGTHIVSERDFREKRLLVRANGTVEMLTIYGGATLLKASCEVVLSRKPKKETPPVPKKRKTFLGRSL